MCCPLQFVPANIHVAMDSVVILLNVVEYGTPTPNCRTGSADKSDAVIATIRWACRDTIDFSDRY